MKIAVSACLIGENCKYSGGNNYSAGVVKYLEGHDVVPVCPEVLGGLPIPRKPAEIVGGVVRTGDGTPVDAEFRRGAELALKTVLEEGAELVILQPRSPSCGAGRIYDGTFSGTLIPGDGVFAKMLKEKGIPVISAEELLPGENGIISGRPPGTNRAENS